MKSLAFTISVISLCAHAMQPQSNIISFHDLVRDAARLIPHQQLILNPESIKESKNILCQGLEEHAFEFVNKLYEHHAMRPYIIPIKDDLKKTIEINSQHMDMHFIDAIYASFLSQTFAYLVLHRALNSYDNVILYYTVPGCDFFDTIVQRCAQDHPQRVRFISINPHEYNILGTSINLAPTLIFFHKGKEVYRRIGFDVDAVNQKFTETDSQQYKVAAFLFLQGQINLSIQKYLLS
jgi:hypothetical protein